MNFLNPGSLLARDPVEALAAGSDEAVLAVITGVEGPSYRPVGAAMAIFPGGERAGTLSSGCVESDIAIHAAEVLRRGRPATIRYGRGSPFLDIQLPCGGGLDILLVPRPDRNLMAQVAARRAARQPCRLEIDGRSGAMRLEGTPGETGWTGETFGIRFDPPLRFLVFGKGPEACTFAALVQSAGYPNLLMSPDPETLDLGRGAGCATQQLLSRGLPAGVAADPRTAAVLFFHDHDWEPEILRDLLETPAFYIGAQGSRRARDARMLQLEAMGVAAAARTRLHGPVGLIPSARDAGTLAVSVLAEILAEARPEKPVRE
ncbi:XdhC family protein [Mangrovicoccus algicola]|uniref:XdhC family protein n=1 Tax=Mangrovicoccus algicola TaxID=2771008 RepID=A0A8J7CYW5_9RHOB|nr:XdhC family protein [Mangrovicoccus algicola]MBE3640077.1 XdhC family protein [Mangrovicoccus algicola]